MAMPPHADLSTKSDKEIKRLFLLAYDLNAAVIQLTRAGVISTEQTYEPYSILMELEGEYKLRLAMQEAITGASDHDAAAV